ncbi:3-ketoacyl-CoA synthase 21 [Corchorus olitorius]|uniref:3-ketoacyl-CoA synthase 21 n=1 Tax=Corchorus olitorius TaxID=93759 RepID=A0A1R3H8Y7_9ROSI|nr:3-ketoacyl-CoA synthase 21 [Corchorus olitorius]
MGLSVFSCFSGTTVAFLLYMKVLEVYFLRFGCQTCPGASTSIMLSGY